MHNIAKAFFIMIDISKNQSITVPLFSIIVQYDEKQSTFVGFF
jgi:hypothetical protein